MCFLKTATLDIYYSEQIAIIGFAQIHNISLVLCIFACKTEISQRLDYDRVS